MLDLIMSLWPLIFFTSPTDYAYKCDWRAQEPSDTPVVCINDMQDSAILPDLPDCHICRTLRNIGEVSNPRDTTIAQVDSRIADQWDYG